MGVEPTTGLLAWVQDYGNYVVFFVQVAYWIVMAFVAVWAVSLFKRLVDFKVGDEPRVPMAESAVQDSDDDADDDWDEPVAIEEFVE